MWNYRVVRIKGEVGICEVYYDKGKPSSRTDFLELSAETIEDLIGDIALMQRAFTKPILEDFDKERFNEN